MPVNIVQFSLMSNRGCTIFSPLAQMVTPERRMAERVSGFTLRLPADTYKVQGERGMEHLIVRLEGGKPHDTLPEQVDILHDPYVGDVDIAASKAEGQVSLRTEVEDGVAIGEKGIEGEFNTTNLTLPTGTFTIFNQAGTPQYY